MNFEFFVRTRSVIHQARAGNSSQGMTGVVVTKCGRKVRRIDVSVWGVDEFLDLPARARDLPDCCNCQNKRWPEAVRKDGE